MRKFYLLLLAFCLVSYFCISQAATSFSDLDSSHWAYTVIMKSTGKGIISGYPNGTFMPNKKVSRAEFAKLLVISTNLIDLNPIQYADVSQSHWAYNYISMINPYMLPSGMNFYPENPITREEVAYTILRAMRLDDSDYKEATINRFYDKDQITPGMEKYIILIADNGIMVGNQDGTFNPQGLITRAEITQLLYNISQKFNIKTDTVIDYPVVEDLVYTGQSQHIDAEKGYTFEGDFRAKEPGEYTADVILSSGYRWIDGTRANRKVTWRMYKATPKFTGEKGASVKEESKKTISYKYEGEGTITMQNSNPEIVEATLNTQKRSITLSGIQPGQSTITLYSSETDHYYSSSFPINVEVTSKYERK